MPLGEEALAEARAELDRRGHASVTLIALGGVDLARSAHCFEAGADAVAAIRADLVGVLDAVGKP